MQEKTISGYLTRSLIQFAAHQGMDIEALCSQVGLNPSILTTPDHRILPSVHYGVCYLIAEHLQGELPKIDAIASELSISVRHLQRELQAEGTSFQKLLDQTRQELALRHLEDSKFSIYDIAFLLGFSEPSAFNRAFKRWTGKTPRCYRATR